VPHLVDFDDRHGFWFRFPTVMINIAATPVHCRLRTAPEQMADSVERRADAVQLTAACFTSSGVP
jgi:hypothetical protein